MSHAIRKGSPRSCGCRHLALILPRASLYEVWDYPDIPEMAGMRERKIPNNEELLDQTMLKWEVSWASSSSPRPPACRCMLATA